MYCKESKYNGIEFWTAPNSTLAEAPLGYCSLESSRRCRSPRFFNLSTSTFENRTPKAFSMARITFV
jgi:hypothetical protein